jgi:methylase of polypeptide subunit release factors
MSTVTTSIPVPAPATTLYLESLSPLERSVCQIAESHLQSSFDISRSSGFIAWKAAAAAAAAAVANCAHK